jgi:hypothetical protein
VPCARHCCVRPDPPSSPGARAGCKDQRNPARPTEPSETNGTQRQDMHLSAPHAGFMHRLGRHRVMPTPRVARVCDEHAPAEACPPASRRLRQAVVSVLVGTELFEKVGGEMDSLAVGDEFVVRMPGPWDGPARVVSRTPTSFRLATLDGHLEAGQIEFRVSRDELLALSGRCASDFTPRTREPIRPGRAGPCLSSHDGVAKRRLQSEPDDAA